MVATVSVTYYVERYNGNHWESGYGSYSTAAKAIERLEYWKKEQVTSAWRVICNVECEHVVTQYEPDAN